MGGFTVVTVPVVLSWEMRKQMGGGFRPRCAAGSAARALRAGPYHLLPAVAILVRVNYRNTSKNATRK